MIDGGLIASYLALAVSRGVDRYVSNKIDTILRALDNRVKAKLGVGPNRDLRADPTDPHVLNKIARAVERRAHDDAKFARDLASLRDRLDHEGGRVLLNQTWTSGPVSVGHGNSVHVQRAAGDVAGRDINRVNLRHPGEIHDKPLLVRAGYWISGLLGIIGVGLIAYSIFVTVSEIELVRETGPGWIVENTYLAQGGISFFAAIMFAIFSSVGSAMSRPRQQTRR